MHKICLYKRYRIDWSLIPLSLLGWRVVSRQDPPEDCIDPLGIFMDAQTSESVLKEMGNSQWSEMFFHQILRKQNNYRLYVYIRSLSLAPPHLAIFKSGELQHPILLYISPPTRKSHIYTPPFSLYIFLSLLHILYI